MEQNRIQIMEGYPSNVLTKLLARDNIRKNALPPTLNGHPMQLVLEDILLWDQEILTVSFKGGVQDLHKKIADTASTWSVYANIKFDFGYNAQDNTYRSWQPDDQSSIRVGFSEPGYWSYVGTDSQDPAICEPGDITLNLEQFDHTLPPNWVGTVLHEFGHALGFHHEHQSPVANCDFDWNTLYSYLSGPPNFWSKDQVDHNLKQMPASGLTYSPHDKHSIMHYAFPEWMFLSGADSLCFSQGNITLSEKDKEMAGKAYPFEEEQKLEQRTRRNTFLVQILKFPIAFNDQEVASLNSRLYKLNAKTDYRHAFIGNENISLNQQVKKAILIAAGQAAEDPANLGDQISIGNLLPTDFSYQFLADLLDELVKIHQPSAFVKLVEVSGADTVFDCIQMVKAKL